MYVTHTTIKVKAANYTVIPRLRTETTVKRTGVSLSMNNKDRKGKHQTNFCIGIFLIFFVIPQPIICFFFATQQP